MIIDAQMHLWADTADYPTPESYKIDYRPEFTVEQALAIMDAHGVARSVLVPVKTFFTGPTKNHYSLEAARAHPDRFAVMGLFERDDPEAAEVLRTWKQPGMLGVRRFFLDDAEAIVSGRLDWLWGALLDYDLPIMSGAPGNMHVYATVLKKFPGLRLIIDHAGRRPFGPRDEAAWADLDATLDLARFESVAIKVSSLPSFSSAPYPFPGLHEPIRRIYEAFGPRRMLWGSDYSRLDWGYSDNLRLFDEALTFLSEDDKAWVLGKSAALALGWR